MRPGVYYLLAGQGLSLYPVLTDPRSIRRSVFEAIQIDQGSVGDCGLFRYRQFERVSEIPGIPATHTVPTLFPNQQVATLLIPGPIGKPYRVGSR